MKLRKTKSAVAVLLAVMLLLSTMIMAPVSASAATAGESVGDWDNTSYNYVHYSFDSSTWHDAVVTNQNGKYLTPEIEIPDGVTTIHVVFSVEWGNGPKWFKQGPASREIQPVFGDENGRFFAYLESTDYWEYGQQGEGTDLLDIPVRPTSKITFRYIDFNNLTTPKEFVYGCYMTSLPVDAVKSVGNVAIDVTPESDVYTASRNVTINVTDIPSDLPLDQVTVDTSFAKGNFTPANRVNDTDNHTITITGTLNGFAAEDVGTGYQATATASSTYSYTDAQNVTYTFTASSATDTYDIEAATPSIVTEAFSASLSLSKSDIYADEATTLTATVPFPEHMPASSYADVDLTVNDDQFGQHFLTADSSAIVDGQKVYTFTLPANTYSAADSPITFTANVSYNGNDYTDAATNTTYHFVAVNPAQTRLTVSEPPYNNVTEAIGVSVSVNPASTEYDGAATVTVVLTAPTDFPNAKTNLMSATVTDSTGKAMPTPTTSVDTNAKTVTQVYTLQAGRYSASDIGDVVFTGTAVLTGSADFTDTANRINYVFTDGATATATLELTEKNVTVPVIDNSVEDGGLQLEVTPKIDLYNIQRDAVVTVSSIDSHIYAKFGNYDHIALTLTDDKGHTFAEDTTKRNSITTDSFKTAFVVPDNTYTLADVGIVTYTVTATYDGGDIYDATNGTTYSFTDGQTATDTSDLTDYDENLQYSGRYLYLLDAIEVVYVVPAANLTNYTNPVLSVENLYTNDSVINEYAGELNSKTNNYEFKFKVAPGFVVDDMGLTMRATRISDNKTVIGLQRVDSIYTYAYAALNIYKDYTHLTGYPELLSTMVDMLNYAAAVQQYGGHHREKLANDNIAAYQKYSMTEDFSPENKNGNMNVLTTGAIFKIGGTALKFDANITPVFQINPADGQDATTLRWSDDYYVEVKVGTKSHKLTTPTETYIYAAHYQYSKFEFNELMANQLDREIYVTVRETATDAAVSDTYRYSANSYLPRYLDYCDQYGYTPDAKVVAVTAAMARYGESTRQYALKQGHVL